EEAVLAAVIQVSPDDLAQIVDAVGLGAALRAGGRGIVEGGVSAAAQEEAMGAADVSVRPDDLARVVDILRNGVEDGQGSEERAVSAESRVEDETEKRSAVGSENPDDLAPIIDVARTGGDRSGVVVDKRGVGAAAENETVEDAVVDKLPDDLPHV